MTLSLEVLGFAGAAPLQGACPCYLVSDGATTVLLDCGPGALERLWRKGLLARVDAIVISHMHADHVLDLTMYAGEVVRALTGGRRPALYVPEGDGAEVLGRLDAVFAREPSAPTRFEAAFDVRQYRAGDRVQIGGLSLTFAPTRHQQPCYAARVTDGGTVILYGADGSPGRELSALGAGADLMVLEASFLEDEQTAAQHGHMTAGQAGALAREAGAGRLLLTHTFAGVDGAKLRERARAAFGGPVELAREGYRYPPPADRRDA